eukprot:SAG11_NODE_4098_length_2066_cov_0.814438_3_plen_65_part_01
MEEIPTASGAWGLGKVVTWPNGTARAVFSQAEHERSLIMQLAASRSELNGTISHIVLFQELSAKA